MIGGAEVVINTQRTFNLNKYFAGKVKPLSFNSVCGQPCLAMMFVIINFAVTLAEGLDIT